MSQYKNAPISELVFGITFHEAQLGKYGIIFELLNHLKSNFPNINIKSPILDVVLDGANLNSILDQKKSGPILYRLYSKDRTRLVQLQFNKFFLNWIRDDKSSVGRYPGFGAIFSEFKEYITFVASIINNYDADLDFYKSIKQYEILYQDRFSWQELGYQNLSEIDKIINIQLPSMPDVEGKNTPLGNIFSKYSFFNPTLGGHTELTINSGTTAFDKQILIVENTIRGKDESLKIDEWFDKAHTMQINLFEQLFTQEVKTKWQ